MRKNHDTAYIDEKAQLYYINEELPTFAFEVSFLFDSEERIGWLLNDELLTNRYFLLWPHATTTNLMTLRMEDFLVVHGLMIKKRTLRQYLEGLGLSKAVILEKNREIRENSTCGRVSCGLEGVYFYASDVKKYSEAPINIVIARRILENNASAYYDIYPDNLRRLR